VSGRERQIKNEKREEEIERKRQGQRQRGRDTHTQRIAVPWAERLTNK